MCVARHVPMFSPWKKKLSMKLSEHICHHCAIASEKCAHTLVATLPSTSLGSRGLPMRQSLEERQARSCRASLAMQCSKQHWSLDGGHKAYLGCGSGPCSVEIVESAGLGCLPLCGVQHPDLRGGDCPAGTVVQPGDLTLTMRQSLHTPVLSPLLPVLQRIILSCVARDVHSIRRARRA